MVLHLYKNYEVFGSTYSYLHKPNAHKYNFFPIIYETDNFFFKQRLFSTRTIILDCSVIRCFYSIWSYHQLASLE